MKRFSSIVITLLLVTACFFPIHANTPVYDLAWFNEYLAASSSAPQMNDSPISLLNDDAQVEILQSYGILPTLRRALNSPDKTTQKRGRIFIQEITKTNFSDWSPGHPNTKAQDLLIGEDWVLPAVGTGYIPLVQSNYHNQLKIASSKQAMEALHKIPYSTAMNNLSALIGRPVIMNTDVINSLLLDVGGLSEPNPDAQVKIANSPAAMTLIRRPFTEQKLDIPTMTEQIWAARALGDLVYSNKSVQSKIANDSVIMTGITDMILVKAPGNSAMTGHYVNAMHRAGLNVLYHLVSNNPILAAELAKKHPSLKPTLSNLDKSITAALTQYQ